MALEGNGKLLVALGLGLGMVSTLVWTLSGRPRLVVRISCEIQSGNPVVVRLIICALISMVLTVGLVVLHVQGPLLATCVALSVVLLIVSNVVRQFSR